MNRKTVVLNALTTITQKDNCLNSPSSTQTQTDKAWDVFTKYFRNSKYYLHDNVPKLTKSRQAPKHCVDMLVKLPAEGKIELIPLAKKKRKRQKQHKSLSCLYWMVGFTQTITSKIDPSIEAKTPQRVSEGIRRTNNQTDQNVIR